MKRASKKDSKKFWASPWLKVASRSLGGMNARFAKDLRDNTCIQRQAMKTNAARRFLVSVLITLAGPAFADPQLDSWMTTYSGKYARIYATDADKTSGNAVSTWSRGTIGQTIPAYCGVYFIGNSASWVYIRTTGLGSHTMGPWYLNSGHSQLFPNVPKNTATL